MQVHRKLDRLIVVASVLGLLSPIARGVAGSIDDRQVGERDPSNRTTSPRCLVTEPRFPIVVEVPVPFSTVSMGSDLRAEVTPIGVEGRSSTDVDVVAFDVGGRATAKVTWWGDALRRRAPVGSYDVVVTSSAGRSAACVTVARPTTTKVADRIRPPEISTVEVIVIGRQGQPGGMK